MAFTEDLDIFFDTDEFAVEATVNSNTFKVIFDEPTIGIDAMEATIEESHPHFRCKTSDLTAASAAKNDSIIVDGSNYKIAGIRKEIKDISIVWLKTA